MKGNWIPLLVLALFYTLEFVGAAKRDLGKYEYRGLEKLGVVSMLTNLVRGVRKTFLPKKQHRIGKTANIHPKFRPADEVQPSRTIFLVDPQRQRPNLQHFNTREVIPVTTFQIRNPIFAHGQRQPYVRQKPNFQTHDFGLPFQSQGNVIPISPYQWNIIEAITNSIDDEPHYPNFANHFPFKNGVRNHSTASGYGHQQNYPTTTYIKDLDTIVAPGSYQKPVYNSGEITNSLIPPIYRDDFVHNNISIDNNSKTEKNHEDSGTFVVTEEPFQKPISYDPIVDDYGAPRGEPLGINHEEPFHDQISSKPPLQSVFDEPTKSYEYFSTKFPPQMDSGYSPPESNPSTYVRNYTKTIFTFTTPTPFFKATESAFYVTTPSSATENNYNPNGSGREDVHFSDSYGSPRAETLGSITPTEVKFVPNGLTEFTEPTQSFQIVSREAPYRNPEPLTSSFYRVNESVNINEDLRNPESFLKYPIQGVPSPIKFLPQPQQYLGNHKNDLTSSDSSHLISVLPSKDQPSLPRSPRQFHTVKGPANQIFKFNSGDTLVRIFYTPGVQGQLESPSHLNETVTINEKGST